MAQGQLASWDQRWTGGPLCSHADTRCRWSSPAYRWPDGPAYAQGGSLTDWRAPFHRRTEILLVQSICRHFPRATGRCDQGPMGLRTGASTTQGGIGPRSLRGAIMDRPAPTRTDVHDGLRLSPVPAPHGGRAEKRGTGPPPQPGLPAIRQAILDRILRPPTEQCPHCGNLLLQTPKRILPK
ncbi:hypothetical protein KOEU_29300 [Komagataeibacter europaeus]|uniref:Uncharacterized protein n=1 Tax=Komagataeibacter europaeus TaxID=33995 RepID=A0A0M0EF90_KOMEU|nr:hypothetical protein KOEU_29300 [Komagataeibacter europaeus]